MIDTCRWDLKHHERPQASEALTKYAGPRRFLQWIVRRVVNATDQHYPALPGCARALLVATVLVQKVLKALDQGALAVQLCNEGLGAANERLDLRRPHWTTVSRGFGLSCQQLAARPRRPRQWHVHLGQACRSAFQPLAWKVEANDEADGQPVQSGGQRHYTCIQARSVKGACAFHRRYTFVAAVDWWS
eukprot:scaffold1885_cov402-Prasinococcus_capsulatus_cf.AAC.11